jgi:hypothetical protein
MINVLEKTILNLMGYFFSKILSFYENLAVFSGCIVKYGLKHGIFNYQYQTKKK